MVELITGLSRGGDAIELLKAICRAEFENDLLVSDLVFERL